MYDCIVIGAGPAGITAAIYCLRAGKTVLILEKETFGGQITYSPKVENYPGFDSISGAELGDKLIAQAMNLGAEVEMDCCTGIRDLGQYKKVITERGEYEASAVIIASGSRHRLLGLAREEEFIGHGISFCALCDGAFYKDRDIAVIGGGNTALQDAVLLADTARSVTIIQDMPHCTGEVKLVEQLKARSNVKFKFNTVIEELRGDEELTGLALRDTAAGLSEEFPVDGIFVAIGQVPENQPFASVCMLDQRGYIQASEDTLTGKDGIFAAGDCRVKGVRQVVTAMGDGATAALAACRFIDARK